MRNLNVLIAKYYMPDELFVGQVEEVIDMLTDELSKRFPLIQAANKASHIITKYYLNAKV